MARVKALVLTGYGTNCEQESAHAARQSGADEADIAYFSDISSGHVRMENYNFLIFPGGFLDGDDLGSAQAAALRWRFAKTANGEPVIEQLRAFFEKGGIILGICNGFQLLVKLGLLPAIGGKYFERQVSISHNDSARYEDRWVTLRANPSSPCVFTKGVDVLAAPVRHGEGKIVPLDQATLDALEAANLVALRYIDPESGLPTMDYPLNPNGAANAIAGLTDPSGRILGLMPHPEAYNHPCNHPGWTRGEGSALGLILLESGVRYLKNL
ncbi:phosphoribosylformylglycinamidine synthase [Humidesulfovibrio mexicanus]|uniref:Phosphoribosylformylglycinamidine synthase n=1 Tax=Humidesulfovibrio mexicanus TaxID=147047 RepID=A0A238XNB9_9BACT|nr:phosphoribosylformylglycinamidine synthase subunit PurQ [Humidesulfovibrio mexicanus]SNR60475.1 phosphoribosylformylglycinamidine synthase [Humidesulfovibrio mexicanus]